MATKKQAVREPRADARRNVDALLDAAVACLARDPEASIADIAAGAGLGRVTVYGHFGSRAELIDAATTRAIARTNALLEDVDLTGDARTALARLVRATWRIVADISGLLLAAERVLPPDRLHAAHDAPMRRVRDLVDRGREEGAFRIDLPADWLVALVHSVVHGAAGEIAAGRLADDEADVVIAASLLAAFTPPGRRVPVPADLRRE